MSGTLPVKPVAQNEADAAPRKREMNLESISEQVKSDFKAVAIDSAVPGSSRDQMETLEENQSCPTVHLKEPPKKPAKKKNIEFTKEDLERLEGETKIVRPF